jgi:hypothetical protein
MWQENCGDARAPLPAGQPASSLCALHTHKRAKHYARTLRPHPAPAPCARQSWAPNSAPRPARLHTHMFTGVNKGDARVQVMTGWLIGWWQGGDRANNQGPEGYRPIRAPYNSWQDSCFSLYYGYMRFLCDVRIKGTDGMAMQQECLKPWSVTEGLQINFSCSRYFTPFNNSSGTGCTNYHCVTVSILGMHVKGWWQFELLPFNIWFNLAKNNRFATRNSVLYQVHGRKVTGMVKFKLEL